jgi:hypothetical protein
MSNVFVDWVVARLLFMYEVPGSNLDPEIGETY